MKIYQTRALTIACLLGALALILVTTPHDGLAVAADLPADFEPVGDEVGWNRLPARIRHIPTGIVLVLIPPGKFVMGSPETEDDRDRDEVQHVVAVESGFYLAETEMTIAQWELVMGSLPVELLYKDDASLPVQGVSWHATQKLVGQLNAKGYAGWRLPTEVEWEYACRAGTTTAFAFGDNVTPEQVNFNSQRPYADAAPSLQRDHPVPVRSLPANAWGLYEMHGNMWEWCQDLYVVHPEKETSPDRSVDSASTSRVLRGGAWTSRGKQVRSANRDGYPPSSSGEKYGVRLALTIPQ